MKITSKKYKRLPKNLSAAKGDILCFKMINSQYVIGQIVHCFEGNVDSEIVFFDKKFNNIPELKNLSLPNLDILLHGVIICPETIIYSGNYQWYFLGNLPTYNYKVNNPIELDDQRFPILCNSANSFRAAAELKYGLRNDLDIKNFAQIIN